MQLFSWWPQLLWKRMFTWLEGCATLILGEDGRKMFLFTVFNVTKDEFHYNVQAGRRFGTHKLLLTSRSLCRTLSFCFVEESHVSDGTVITECPGSPGKHQLFSGCKTESPRRRKKKHFDENSSFCDHFACQTELHRMSEVFYLQHKVWFVHFKGADPPW